MKASNLRRGLLVAAVVVLLVAVYIAHLGSTRSTRHHEPSVAPGALRVDVWETSYDGSQLLTPQAVAGFAPGTPGGPEVITVDDRQRYQVMEGFGAAITDSSAYVLRHDMSASQRATVMTRLFDRTRGIGLDYLREPIGANDFSTSSYTEDDVPAGHSDPALAHFSIAHDLADLIPVLKQALTINPQIKIVASPWSAPAWMKTNGSLNGGSLRAGDFGVYAAYLVKFVQAYARHGIKITALTMENEPDDPETSYPGMTLTAAQEARLAPILAHDLARAGLHTQILGFDSDWSDASFAASLLGSGAGRYLAGTAFHCYAGAPSAQLAVQSAFPDKGIYETECSGTNAYPSFGGNLVNGTSNLVIGAVRDYSKTVLLWNMVLDQSFGPTNGGCSNCIPNVTVDGANGHAKYMFGYYVLAQVSRFVEPGARRVASTDLGQGNVETVAFENPDGTNVLLALNTNTSTEQVTVEWKGRSFTYDIAAGSVDTFTWGA